MQALSPGCRCLLNGPEKRRTKGPVIGARLGRLRLMWSAFASLQQATTVGSFVCGKPSREPSREGGTGRISDVACSLLALTLACRCFDAALRPRCACSRKTRVSQTMANARCTIALLSANTTATHFGGGNRPPVLFSSLDHQPPAEEPMTSPTRRQHAADWLLLLV